MTNSNIAKFLISGTALLSLSGCGLASMPGGYSSAEQQVVSDLNTANYIPRSAEDRAAILTQDLFAQATFWSREYDLNPADLEAAINLASTLRRLGNPGKSIEVAQTTRALYPRDVDLMAELAAAYIANDNPKKAITLIDSALGQRSDMARLWTLKGAALDQFEQYAEARQHYSRALSIEPNNASAIANVGLSFALEGDPKTAEIWLRRAANMPGASASVRQNLSLVLGLQNKYDEAEKWARRDLDATAVANNMSYIRSLRGVSTPVRAGQRSVGAPAHMPTPVPRQIAPQRSSSLTPRTYGGPTPTVKPTAAYQPLRTASPQMTNPQASNSQVANPLAKYSQYSQQKLPSTRLKMAGDISKYEGGPRTSRDIALAIANKTSAYGTLKPTAPNGQMKMRQPQIQQQAPPPSPQNLLGRISQNNTPKRAIAQRQRQQLASRFQNQRQNQYRAQQQGQQQGMQARQQGMQAGQPQNYSGQNRQVPAQMPSYGAPAPYANTANPVYGQPQQMARGNGQNYGNPQRVAQMAPQYAPQYAAQAGTASQQARQPARQRRR